MLTITTIATQQPEETKEEGNFSETITLGENFEWSGQGAATLGLATTVAKAPESEV